MDRRLGISIGAGFAALGAGLGTEVFDQPALGVVSGVCGLIAAIAATALAARGRTAEDQLHELNVDRARLRRELDALAAIFAEEATRRSGTPAPEPSAAGDAEPEPAIDPISGLLEPRFFRVLVAQRVAAARRQLQPVSIVLFELDGFGQVESEVKDEALGVLGEVIGRTLRECDAACRVSDTMAAAVLEDTAEAGAVWAAERVRGTLHGSPVGDSLTISAGIACYPSHALHAAELVDQAGRALESARARGRDHVEIAQPD